ARKIEVAAEDLLAEAPQIFRDRAHWAEPTAKGFAKQKSNRRKGDEQKHRGWMHCRHMSSQQPVFEVHHAGDGKPAFDAGGSHDASWGGVFELPHPEIESRTQVEVHDQEGELHGATQGLRVIMLGAAHEFVPRLSGRGT